MGALAIAPSGASAAQFFSGTDSIAAGDLTHNPRLLRDGLVDNCTTTNGVATFGSGNFHYDLYTFTNRTNDTLCVTVNLDATGCGADIFSGAYAPSFDPTALTTNGLGDPGASDANMSYSFNAPPGDFAVNVHEVVVDAGCASYGITLDSLQPFADAPPTITGGGTAKGQTLTGAGGTWNGTPSLTNQWRRCNPSGGSCTDIAGANATTYVPTGDDVGSTLRFREIATEAGQSSSADSARTDVISGSQFFSATGALTAGDATQTGRLLRPGTPDTCTTTDGVSLFTATGERHFDLYGIDNITNQTQCVTVVVDPKTCTATNFLFSGAYVPSFDPAAITTNGVADIGSSPDTVPLSYSFNAPPGAFAVNVSEVTPDALCAEYGIVLASLGPFAISPPTISGPSQLNSAQTVNHGNWGGSPAFAQQWRRCNAGGGSCTDIAGATSATYVPTAADLGSTLRVRVIATESNQTSSADSAQSAVIGPDTIAPETEITKEPKNNVFLRGPSLRGSSLFLERADKVKAKYRFESSEPGSTFECKFDKKKFKPCDSPKKLNADLGKHKFKVKATDTAGNTDPSPDKDKFKVKEK